MTWKDLVKGKHYLLRYSKNGLPTDDPNEKEPWVALVTDKDRLYVVFQDEYDFCEERGADVDYNYGKNLFDNDIIIEKEIPSHKIENFKEYYPEFFV